MRKTLRHSVYYFLTGLFVMGLSREQAHAQTQPSAVALPFSFTSVGANALPAGVAVHNFGTTTGLPTTRSVAPGVGDLNYNATPNSGGWLAAGASGVDGIGMLASGSQAAGAIVVAVNTTGKTNIKVSWTARTILQQASRDNSLALQYRLGTTGNFTDLGVARHVYTSAGKTAGTGSNFNFILPAALENQPYVQLRWVYWESSAGLTGSRDRIALDDVTVDEAGPDVDAPLVDTYSPANASTGVLLNAVLSLTFSEDVTKQTGTIQVKNLTDNTEQTIDVAGSEVSVTDNVVTLSGVTLDYQKSYAIIVPAGSFTDAANNAFAGILTDNGWAFTTVAPPGLPTKISAIQGSGATTTMAGIHTIDGVVTRTFIGTNGLSGFFVQEEDADSDGNPATSEAIFVYNVAADAVGLLNPAIGDKVNLTGTVGEFTATTSGVATSRTEIKTITQYQNLGAATLPTATDLVLPVNNVTDLERFEGMLVNLRAASGNLAVTEYYQLGRYGQIVLAATGASNQPGTDARLDQYTQFNEPSTAGYAAYQADLAKRRIYLDDGSTRQNPDPILFGRGGNPLSASNTLRGGDEIDVVTGILDERLEGYRIQTNTGVNFTATNTRPTAIPNLSGGATNSAPTLIVTSTNVLNYFTSMDAGEDLYRGANNATEFGRQKAKIIRALIGTGADVLGLMEIQSNGPTPTTALADLVSGLNADAASSGTYAFIDPATTGTSISTDATTVGIIYKTDKVTPVGNAATLSTSAAFNLVGRRPLAQTFTQNSNSQVFTVVVNHFKSKSSSAGGAGDADQLDGQGESNGTRSRQATDLANWLATAPTGTTDKDYLILGDLNAYAREQPLTILDAAGYRNQLPATTYSYVFDGQIGSLDHALASSTLAPQVTGSGKWHINADEPSVLDYNTEFKSSGQITSLYSADAYRASDHDPVLIGLNLTSSLPVKMVSFDGQPAADRNVLTWETTEEVDNAGFRILRSANGKDFTEIGYVEGKGTTTGRQTYTFNDHDIAGAPVLYYRLEQLDFDGTSELSRIISVKNADVISKQVVYPNPGQGVFNLAVENLDPTSIAVIDVLGRTAKVYIGPDAAGATNVLVDQKHPSGLYLIRFRTKGSLVTQTRQLVIVR